MMLRTIGMVQRVIAIVVENKDPLSTLTADVMCLSPKKYLSQSKIFDFMHRYEEAVVRNFSQRQIGHVVTLLSFFISKCDSTSVETTNGRNNYW